MNDFFARIYFDPSNPSGFGSIHKLTKAAQKNDPKITLNDVKDWARYNDTYTLHKKRLRKYPMRKTISRGLDHQWQMDLVDLTKYARQNNNYRFILTSIDVFSRYAFAVPIKNKSGTQVAAAMEKIFILREPKIIQVDKGSEFYNSSVDALLKKKRYKTVF